MRTLKATVRALYSAVEVVGSEGDTFVVAAPSEMHKKKCLELQEHVRATLSAAAGRPITLEVRVQTSRTTPAPSASKPTSVDTTDIVDDSTGDDEPVESVVDQIAKSFPGARIVDSSKK